MPRGDNQSAANVSKGIGRYLDSLENASVDGKGRVSLGAIGNGLPAWTTNPDDVERAIKILGEQARKGTAVTRLKKQQRIITLMRSLEMLRASADNNDRAYFIEHAHAWALANGIGYGAFRMMGVPPSVLTAAGITRTFEP